MTTAWVARHGMTSQQYQTEFDSLGAQGYRLVEIDGCGVNGQALYAAIWDKSNGPAWVARHGMTSAQYQAEFDSLVKQGYRLVEIDGYEVNGQALYAAIWEKSSGPPWVARHGMTSAQYQAEFDSLVKQGYRLVEVDGYAVNGQVLYAAIWEKDATVAPNPVKNPSFETVGGLGSKTTFTGLWPGPCAAADWEVFNNTSATTTTELVPTTCPNGGSRMIHVTTDGANNGLCQQWQSSGGLPNASFSVWVYVLQGKVGVGIGNGGNTSLTSFSTSTNAWEPVPGTNLSQQSPVNEICIYSSEPGVADFYVDLVSVA